MDNSTNVHFLNKTRLRTTIITSEQLTGSKNRVILRFQDQDFGPRIPFNNSYDILLRAHLRLPRAHC